MTNKELMQDPAYLNPEYKELLASKPPPLKLDRHTDIEAVRQQIRDKKQSLARGTSDLEDTDIEEADLKIPSQDGSEITIRIYRSRRSRSCDRPVLVAFHGGGWILGTLDNEAPRCRKWCELFDGVAVNVDYRLAPQHVFPTALNDCYDAFKWTIANIAQHDGNPQKALVLLGSSAGGNMAAAISHLHLATKPTTTPITGLYLSVPILLSPEAVPDPFKPSYQSRTLHRTAPLLNQESLDLFERSYKPNPTSPLYSPFLFLTNKSPSDALREEEHDEDDDDDPRHSLPPHYFQINGLDPLRDEALLYERVLRERYGVRTRADLYAGLPHGFATWWPEAEFTKRLARDSVEGMRWLMTGPPHAPSSLVAMR